MRASLQRSLRDSPDPQFERYPKGSIVLCNACGVPIFKLDRAICLGDKGGKTASAFKPLRLADLDELEMRPDIDAGVRARVKAWTPEQKRDHLACLTEPKAGEAMACPACFGSFAQVLTVDATETHDRAYVIELLTIPPFGTGRPAPVTGKVFAGDRGDWVH